MAIKKWGNFENSLCVGLFVCLFVWPLGDDSIHLLYFIVISCMALWLTILSQGLILNHGKKHRADCFCQFKQLLMQATFLNRLWLSQNCLISDTKPPCQWKLAQLGKLSEPDQFRPCNVLLSMDLVLVSNTFFPVGFWLLLAVKCKPSLWKKSFWKQFFLLVSLAFAQMTRTFPIWWYWIDGPWWCCWCE